MLKQKEKELPPPQISIALRPTSSNHNDSNSAAPDANHRPLAIQSKPSTNTAPPAASKDQNASATVDAIRPVEIMTKPMPLISDYYHIQTNVQDVLIEGNADFFVVGIVGTQHTGKSFIANLLIDDMDNVQCSMWDLLNGRNEIFKTGISKLDAKHQPSTEGIQVFITKHRTILLDCSPVLCNPYKKDAILSELDDLKMLMFLLSVCNQLIVVEDSSFNMNLLRLLRTADQMKLDLNADKGAAHIRFTPTILFVKNKCRKQSFRNESRERTNRMYRMFFHECDMKIYTTPKATKTHNKLCVDEQKNVNLFYFSFLEENCKYLVLCGILVLVKDLWGVKGVVANRFPQTSTGQPL